MRPASRAMGVLKADCSKAAGDALGVPPGVGSCSRGTLLALAAAVSGVAQAPGVPASCKQQLRVSSSILTHAVQRLQLLHRPLVADS